MKRHEFTNPFRYTPSAEIQIAAKDITCLIEKDPSLKEAFGQGKMLGVLIAKDSSGNKTILAGFSGNVCGKNMIPGFVPPIFDLLSPEGHFKIQEMEISNINKEIDNICNSQEYTRAIEDVLETRKKANLQISEYKARMALAKAQRQKLRSILPPESGKHDELIRESQFMKAELRRIKHSFESVICEKEKAVSNIEEKISILKKKRQQMSESLQQWLFRQYKVQNAWGEEKTILDIFAAAGLTPPAGTGECAAPKLLQYAYTHGMEPLEMGEFWYGASPEKEIKVSGHFYPSCQNKCGPLLGFMLQGLNIRKDKDIKRDGSYNIIYSDDSIIVCDKPSGMPSVPGKNGMISLLEILSGKFGAVFAVHRLDMDTSGLIVFAKSIKVQKILQTQFASRTVIKTYKARLFPVQKHTYEIGTKGRISLPLIADINDRPRQMVDYENGKEAITDFEITDVTPESIEVIFHPLTGRTHQLRVHSAHPKGLNAPIMGDRLYGGTLTNTTIENKNSAARHDSLLSLRATELIFEHPVSKIRMRLCLDE